MDTNRKTTARERLAQRLTRVAGELQRITAADYWARTRLGHPAAHTRPTGEGCGGLGDRAAHGSGGLNRLAGERLDQRDLAAGGGDDPQGGVGTGPAIAVTPGFRSAFFDAEKLGGGLVANLCDVVGELHGYGG